MLGGRFVCLRLDLLLFPRFCRWRGLLGLRYFLFQRGGGEGLAVKRNLGDTHRGERLTMSPQALVLLLALVMENQNFLVSAFFHHLADHARFRLRPGDLTLAAGYGQHVAKFDGTVRSSARFFYSNHIAGRHPVLLATGADDRVHTYASINSTAYMARPEKLQVSCACSFRSGSTSEKRGKSKHRKLAIFLRSEEHTSELQSRQYLVCRLLLEKKKKTKTINT